MIKGLLLYNENDAKINTWFIEHLTNVSKNNGIDLSFLLFNQETFANNAIDFRQFDFCINRTRYSCVNEILEAYNVRCYNNLRTVDISNDKWLTFLLCRKLGIPVMETVKFNNYTEIKFDFPFVVKSRNGHGGNEVFWINNAKELQNIVFSNNTGYIAQKTVSNIGVDVRIYVLGGTPIIGVKRTSLNDFRSNFSLGGKVELFHPTNEQICIIKKIQAAISSDYVGIDFMFHNGNWVLNEIEDVVGAKMLYSLCNYDIGEKYIHYIRKDIQARE